MSGMSMKGLAGCRGGKGGHVPTQPTQMYLVLTILFQIDLVIQAGMVKREGAHLISGDEWKLVRSNGPLPSHCVNIGGINGCEDYPGQHLAFTWLRNVQIHDVETFEVILCFPSHTLESLRAHVVDPVVPPWCGQTPPLLEAPDLIASGDYPVGKASSRIIFSGCVK